MNRRSFLKFLGLAPVAVVAAVALKPKGETLTIHNVKGMEALEGKSFETPYMTATEVLERQAEMHGRINHSFMEAYNADILKSLKAKSFLVT